MASEGQTYEGSASGKPLLKRSGPGTFKTVLSLDGGALRGIIVTSILIEVEDSIKQYWLEHPECLPEGVEVASVDDFDVNLADYFDCIAGTSSGGWLATYLASRGGQGASRAVLDDPAVVEKYGSIPTGGAAGLRVLFYEYGSTIYPSHTMDLKAGVPLDVTNPSAPGTTTTIYSLEGLERSMEAFVGNATLADADTSLLVPAVDLGTGYTVFFVQNRFKDPPVTSAATLISRDGPRVLPAEGERVFPDISFAEGRDYYLKDVATASGTIIAVNPAKRMTQVGSDEVDYVMVSGGVTVGNADFFGALFVSNECGLCSFDKVAVMSVGIGLELADYRELSSAGSVEWSKGLKSFVFQTSSVSRLAPSLMDYLYYANPATKPFQYLRINGLGPDSEEHQPMFGDGDQKEVPKSEDFGRRVAKEHRQFIDLFVRDFIFG